jgi:hypothetical protein
MLHQSTEFRYVRPICSSEKDEAWADEKDCEKFEKQQSIAERRISMNFAWGNIFLINGILLQL